MRVLSCGDSAVLIELANLSDAISVAAHLKALTVRGVEEVTLTGMTVLATFAGDIDPAEVEANVRSALAHPALELIHSSFLNTSVHPGVVELTVEYGTRDLVDVARLHQTSVEDIIGWHTDAAWSTHIMADHPGLWYMNSSSTPLILPAKAKTDTVDELPPGAVLIGPGYTAVHTFGGPSRWHHIGTVIPAHMERLKNLETEQSVKFVSLQSAEPFRKPAAHAAKAQHAPRLKAA